MEVIEKYYQGPILGKKPAKKRQEEGKIEEGKIMERMEGMGKEGCGKKYNFVEGSVGRGF